MKKTGHECFVAIDEGPPKRRMWLSSHYLVPEQSPSHHLSGWEIVIEQKDAACKWQPHWDTIADTFVEALLYPPEYLKGDVVWREEKTGKIVDIYKLEFEE